MWSANATSVPCGPQQIEFLCCSSNATATTRRRCTTSCATASSQRWTSSRRRKWWVRQNLCCKIFHLFSSFSDFSTLKLSCQQDLNSDCRSRRQECWPLNNHQILENLSQLPKLKWDYTNWNEILFVQKWPPTIWFCWINCLTLKVRLR